MEIDPLESATAVNEGSSNPTAASRLSSWVAITVALLATFLGICKVKDDNIVQAMQQAQADRLDHWSFYQTRNVREEIAKATLVQLELAESSAPVTEQAKYQKAITTYRDLASSQSQKKDELRKQSEQDQQTYDSLNYRDDQFDLSDTLVALAISMLALTALTHKSPRSFFVMTPTASSS